MAASTFAVGPANWVALNTKHPPEGKTKAWRATCLADQVDWNTGECCAASGESLEDLIARIVRVHHCRLRRQLVTNWTLLDQTFLEADTRHLALQSLLPVGKMFESLLDKLVDCMIRGERVVFPQIARLEPSERKSLSKPLPWNAPLCQDLLTLEGSQFGCLLAVRKLNDLAGQVDSAIQQCDAYRNFVRELATFSSGIFQYLFEVNCLLLERAKAIGREQTRSGKLPALPCSQSR